MTKRLTPAERTRLHPNSAKLAIAAFCFRCVGGGNDADSKTINLAKADVRDCTATECPLHFLRPWQKMTTGIRKAKNTP